LPLVRARVQAATTDSHQMPLIRRYTLGPSPKVYDLRHGVTTGRLDNVLKGHLDGMLLVKMQAERGVES